MAEVIIFQNPNGQNVCVCHPTGELPIKDVLVKDCPAGATIVDDSTLPQGADTAFFDAWRLVNGAITVDLTAAQTVATNNLNALAKNEAQHRLTNTSIGLNNKLADADWLTLLTTARAAITAAKTTTDLLLAAKPVQDAIVANA